MAVYAAHIKLVDSWTWCYSRGLEESLLELSLLKVAELHLAFQGCQLHGFLPGNGVSSFHYGFMALGRGVWVCGCVGGVYQTNYLCINFNAHCIHAHHIHDISEAIFIAAAQLYKNGCLLRIRMSDHAMRKKKNTRDCFVYFQSDFSIAILTAGEKNTPIACVRWIPDSVPVIQMFIKLW